MRELATWIAFTTSCSVKPWRIEFLARADTIEAAPARFRKEVRVARQVSHPNMGRLCDTGFIERVSLPFGASGDALLETLFAVQAIVVY